MFAPLLTEGPTQRVDALAEVALFDDGVRPQSRHQLFFAHDDAWARQKVAESVECFRCNRYRGAVAAREQPFSRVEPILAELVDRRWLLSHQVPLRNLENV